MKTASRPLAAALLLAVLLPAAGCVSSLVSPPSHTPRYLLAPPAPPAAFADALPAAPVCVLGRVRAAEAASTTAICTFDAETGKTGILLDGEFALPPATALRPILRSWLAAAAADAQIFDASLAPRTAPRTTLEAWIETFALVKTPEGWTFRAALTLTFEAPDGTLTSLPLAASLPVSATAARPTAPQALAAATAALSSLAPRTPVP